MGPAAAETIGKFLKSSSHNLRYIGIDALARIVRINAKYAAEHQMAVIDCLEDPDETLKNKTLQLLHKMTKPNNVEVKAACCCNLLMSGLHSGCANAYVRLVRPRSVMKEYCQTQIRMPATKVLVCMRCWCTLLPQRSSLSCKLAVSGVLQVIVGKMMDYLRAVSDDVQKLDAVRRIHELAERFAPDMQWFLDTMNQVT